MLGGAVIYPFDQAKEVLKFYSEYSITAPDELTADAILMTSPEGQRVIVISVCYVGEFGDGERVLRPLRTFGHPLANQIGPVSYVELQRGADPLFPTGLHFYWKSGFVTDIGVSPIEALVEHFPSVSSPRSLLVFQQFGGAVGRIARDATAFGHRHAQYDFIIASVWSDPAESDSHVRWARQTWELMQPFTSGAFYLNNLCDESEERVRAAYGENFERLVALKSKYDPTNLFRLTANVRPTAGRQHPSEGSDAAPPSDPMSGSESRL